MKNNILLEDNHIPLIGGTVFGYGENEKGRVSVNGVIYENACAYMLITNLTGKARVYRENIYGKLNDRAHVVTKVNLAEKELTELDHRPAADVYMQETGVSREGIIDNVLENPLGRVVDEKIYISSMHTLKSDGAFLNYKKINKNDTIYILKLLDYKKINQQTREAILQDFKQGSLIISCNCIYRYLLFQRDNYLNEFLNDMSQTGNFVGTICGGEQYNRQHINQTMVCAVFD